MKKRRFAGICIAVLLAGMTGCANEAPATQTETELSTQTESRTKAEETENVSATAAKDSSDSVEDVAGQGFVPPKGSRVDSNGNIATPSGETLSKTAAGLCRRADTSIPRGASSTKTEMSWAAAPRSVPKDSNR